MVFMLAIDLLCTDYGEMEESQNLAPVFMLPEFWELHKLSSGEHGMIWRSTQGH